MVPMPALRSFTYPGEAVERPVVFIPYSRQQLRLRLHREGLPPGGCWKCAKRGVLQPDGGRLFSTRIRRMKEGSLRAISSCSAAASSAGDEPDGSGKFIANVLNKQGYFGGNTSSAPTGAA